MATENPSPELPAADEGGTGQEATPLAEANPVQYPTQWQKKTVWMAISAISLAVIAVISGLGIWVVAKTLAFFQPILVPFAVAGVLAYLAEPVVQRLVKWGTSRVRAVMSVFAVTTIAIIGVLLWVIPVLSSQAYQAISKVPVWTTTARVKVTEAVVFLRDTYKIRLVPDELLDAARYPETIASNPLVGEAAKDGSRVPPVARAGAFTGSQNAGEQNGEAVTPSGPPLPIGVPSGNAAPVLASGGEEMAGKTPGYVIDRILGVTGSDGSRGSGGKEAKEDPRVALEKIFTGEWVATAVPAVFRSVIGFLSSGIGGFLGVFGYLLSFIIVPLYLFYLLAEAESIKKYWGNLLPLKASRFRDEVVDTVNEINRYLIAFFRGQLVVSFINGIATCTGLMFVGLDFSLIIGIAHCFLGTIPYVGNILCWIPAVIIASVQGGSWLIPATAPGWVFPLVVTGIFVVWQQIDGLFITPKIVGDQVGLHPMTVMFSVFFWSMILGGLLGAILAIPLTATLKVVMKRYVWDRTILGQGVVAEISS